MRDGRMHGEWKSILQLVLAIARIGKANQSVPTLREIGPFHGFFLPNGTLDRSSLDARDGACTRRELLARYLVLSSVLDQGPDMTGVRMLLAGVTNSLYLREIRFLHKPEAFFKELNIAIEGILSNHASIKTLRAEVWAASSQTNASKYNLFMDNSTQSLNYAVFRWGVPIALPLVLEKDCKRDEQRSTALLDYLESWHSAEEMSNQLKDHPRYGLGKAIGDKACHLLAKWMVSSFGIIRRTEPSWNGFSFEVPYDSNAGRVLWRTGYFLNWAGEDEYKRQKVIQPGQGKGGTNYIRVTNIRGMTASTPLADELRMIYDSICMNNLKTHSRPPRVVQIQRIQHAFLRAEFSSTRLTVADFDDGLMTIGTRWCLNIGNPLCGECPIRGLCQGAEQRRELVENYRT